MQIQRRRELGKLSALKDKNVIKVVTGVRHCGKSPLLSQFQNVLKKEKPNTPIISINVDLPEFRFLAEQSWKQEWTNGVQV